MTVCLGAAAVTLLSSCLNPELFSPHLRELFLCLVSLGFYLEHFFSYSLELFPSLLNVLDWDAHPRKVFSRFGVG